MLKMAIADILNSDLISVSSEASTVEAVRVMRKNNISCVLIMDGQTPLGIFTERNLLQTVGDGLDIRSVPVCETMSKPVLVQQKSTSMLSAYDFMRRKKIRHLVVVDENQNCLGIISQTDIINHLIPKGQDIDALVADYFNPMIITAPLSGFLRDYFKLMTDKQISCLVVVQERRGSSEVIHSPLGVISERDAVKIVEENTSLDDIKLADVMSSPVVTVGREDSLQQALNMMSENKVRRLVVVEQNGQISGLLTQSDIVQGLGASYLETLSTLLNRAREGERRYRNLFENALEGIFQVTSQGKVLEVNPALAAMHGYSSPAEFMEAVTDIRSQLYVDDSDYNTFVSTLQEKGQILKFEAQFRKRDGSVFWGSVSAHLVTDDEGQETLIEGNIEDCSKHRDAMQKIQQTGIEAAKANQTKNELLGLLNQGIRTPLMSIMGAYEMLAQSTDNIENRDLLELARQSCDSLMLAVNDAMDLVNFENNSFVLEDIFFNFYELIEKTLKNVQPMARENDIRLRTAVDPSTAPLVCGDANRLRQVLTNLILNLISHTYGGEISLALDFIAPSQMYQFTLQSTDATISGDHPNYSCILSEYGTEGEPELFSGAGLGLPICERIIKAMGGEINFSSRAKKELTYKFTVSLASREMETGLEAFREKLGRAKALVVDDNYSQRYILCEHLATLGINFLEADSLPDALNILNDSTDGLIDCDFIFASANMKGLSEDQTVSELRQLYQDKGQEPRPLIMICPRGQVCRTEFGPEKVFKGTTSLKQPFSLAHVSDSIIKALKLDMGPVVIPTSTCLPGQFRVLLADGPWSRQIISYYLEQCGCEVDLAGNGMEAFELFASEDKRYDLVLLELNLQQMTGIDTARLMRELEHEKELRPAHIVGLCAHLSPARKDMAINSGIEAILIKPFEKAKLIRVINELFAY